MYIADLEHLDLHHDRVCGGTVAVQAVSVNLIDGFATVNVNGKEVLSKRLSDLPEGETILVSETLSDLPGTFKLKSFVSSKGVGAASVSSRGVVSVLERL